MGAKGEEGLEGGGEGVSVRLSVSQLSNLSIISSGTSEKFSNVPSPPPRPSSRPAADQARTQTLGQQDVVVARGSYPIRKPQIFPWAQKS